MGKLRRRSGLIGNSLTAAGGIYNMVTARRKKPYKRADNKKNMKRKVSKSQHTMSSSGYTKTKKKRGKESIEAIHGELVRRYERIQLYSGPRHHVKISRGCWKMNHQFQYILKALESKQNVVAFPLVSKSQMITSLGAGFNSTTYNDAYASYFDSNPYQTNTGGGLYGSVVTPSDDRVKLRHLRVKAEFANLETIAPVTVDLYVVQAKRNVNVDPANEWGNILQSQALGKPLYVQQAAGVAYTPGYGNQEFLDNRPDFIPAWKKYYRVLRKKRFTLASGANAVQTLEFDFGGKIVDKKFINDTPSAYVGGMTMWLMFIIRGSVIKDVSAGINQATVSPAELGIVYTTETVLEAVNGSRIQAEFEVPALYTGGAAANLQAPNVVDVLANIVQL